MNNFHNFNISKVILQIHTCNLNLIFIGELSNCAFILVDHSTQILNANHHLLQITPHFYNLFI